MSRIDDLSDVSIKYISHFISIKLNENDTKQIVNRVGTGLIFASSGKLFYDINGKRLVSDPNHALLLPKGGNYTLTCVEKSESLLVNFMTDPPLENMSIVSYNLGNNPYYLKTYNYLENLWTFKKSSYKLRCLAGLYDLLAKLNDLGSMTYNPSFKYELILPSIEYLERHYNDSELSNGLLADKSGISTVYFRKLFTKKYGISPMKYVLNRRIEKAQEMLQSEYNSINGIAEAVGFNSINLFSRAFKKMTGYAPSEFIRFNSSRQDYESE